ncbi:NUDIX hydrolase [Saccharothrix longispora]|uniref:NUDIX hydrolase n=1 Tax=Saccharothrix longispora TaxID=33920 RepID=UPI0028FDB2FE|nr:NUDIX hydrolase [Saccharothrix longispora]MBY8850951.1 NUDIX hydrolase [Saccharothrix sp. MB29]MDU0293765.1 NUDIX hydrolase [Saccharothrix longispora]
MTESEDEDVLPVRRLSSREIYRNPWLTVREDKIERQDGSRGIYSIIDRPDFAVIVPTENDGFHLVSQYRYPVSGRYWEFPQGSFPDWRPVDPIELASAELAEETGLRARSFVDLGSLFSWHGASSQVFNVVVATELEQGAPNREITEQDMQHRWVSRSEFEQMIHQGEIKDNSTLAAYTLLKLNGFG